MGTRIQLVQRTIYDALAEMTGDQVRRMDELAAEG
jgi:hypothetical protein